MSERRVPTRLGELQVREVTPPGAVRRPERTAVLWPSVFGDVATWETLVPLLPATHRLVLVDGPGLGRSEPLRRRTSVAEAAGAAADLLSGLGLREPVDWVGNAFGGHVGYELAVRPGVLRSLVAVSAPVEPVPPPLRRQVRLLLPLLAALGPVGPVRAAVLEAMLTDASRADPRVRGVVVASLARPARPSLARAVRSFVLDRREVTDLLGRASAPCLFVAGDDRGDWTPEAARASAARAPRARAAVVTGARTLVPLEQPAALAALVAEFWQELDGG